MHSFDCDCSMHAQALPSMKCCICGEETYDWDVCPGCAREFCISCARDHIVEPTERQEEAEE
jgi:hypothetical protein